MFAGVIGALCYSKRSSPSSPRIYSKLPGKFADVIGPFIYSKGSMLLVLEYITNSQVVMLMLSGPLISTRCPIPVDQEYIPKSLVSHWCYWGPLDVHANNPRTNDKLPGIMSPHACNPHFCRYVFFAKFRSSVTTKGSVLMV